MMPIVDNSNSNFRQSKKWLDMEIDKLTRLMMKVPRKRCTNVKKVVNNRQKLSVQEIINKVNGRLQYNIWRLGERRVTKDEAIEQHHDEMVVDQL